MADSDPSARESFLEEFSREVNAFLLKLSRQIDVEHLFVDQGGSEGGAQDKPRDGGKQRGNVALSFVRG